jgi:hypothetical protein
MDSKLEQKFFNKVCAIAEVAEKDLSPDAVAFVRAHTRKWVAERHVADRDVKNLARELCSRFSIRRVFSVEPQLQTERRSVDLAPIRSESVQETTAAEKSTFLKWPPRPQVLHRMQRLAADKGVQEAISREAAELEEQKRRDIEQKWVMKELTRREMAAQERARQAAIERQREEREKNRLAIMQAIDEAKEAEKDAAEQRRARCLAERKQIEEQRLAEIARQEKTKQRKRQENEIARRQLEEELAQVKAVEKERAAVMKQSLVDFLNEGLSILRHKDEHGKKCDVLPETRLSAKEEILARRERNLIARKQALEARRNRVCAQFADQAAIDAQRMAEEERRIADAAELAQQLHKRRLEQEAQHKHAARKLLVASLEEEISHQRTQRQIEELEKNKLREELNAAAEEESLRKAATRKKVLEAQRERKKLMDMQLEQRMIMMLTPEPKM